MQKGVGKSPFCVISPLFILGRVMPKAEIRYIAGYDNITNILCGYRLSLGAVNRSPKTISWYMDILGRYFAFLSSHQLLKPIQKLGKQELTQYVLHLQNSTRWPNTPYIKENRGKLSQFSVQGHVRAIKAFWSWLFREEYIASNNVVRFPLPKVPKPLVKTLSAAQVKKLISGIDRGTPSGVKQYCILLLFLDTGIRVSEVIHLKIDDVDVVHGLLKVIGKGQKERLLPISRFTKRKLLRYINSYRPLLCKTETSYLFAACDGEAISVNSVQQFLRRLSVKMGLTEVKCSPHIFRHTFATRSLANGANVLVLRDIMGHESLQTTMKYTHLQYQDIQKQHAVFSPVREFFEDLGPK